MSKGNRDSNNDRSNSMNRNNYACKAAMDNRSNQMNPNHKECEEEEEED